MQSETMSGPPALSVTRHLPRFAGTGKAFRPKQGRDLESLMTCYQKGMHKPALPWLRPSARICFSSSARGLGAGKMRRIYCVDHYRRHRRVWQNEVSDEAALSNAPAQAANSGASTSLAPLLLQLPDSHRELLVMLKILGLSQEEVARATGSTTGAVKQKAHRAYENLRKLIRGAGAPAAH